MIPALLITFREVVEATLIVATILGMLIKLREKQALKFVWLGALSAAICSWVLLVGASFLGIKVQMFFQGRLENIFEGCLMLISAVFITWAVFWLHQMFTRKKLRLLQQVNQTVSTVNSRAIFFLSFTAVFREGMEIVLFLATIYMTSSPKIIMQGFISGLILALIFSGSVFTATVKLPLHKAFQLSTFLLVLFAAGLAGRGVQELVEIGWLPQLQEITLNFIPASGNLIADLLKIMLGWSREMGVLQLVIYAGYLSYMSWYFYNKSQINYSRTV